MNAFTAVRSVVRLEAHQILQGRKVLVILLLLAGAAAMGFLVRRFAPDPEVPWGFVYLFMMVFLYLHTMVILIPLLFFTSLVREETDAATWVYLQTRPIRKPVLLLAKFLAAWAASAVLVCTGMVLFHAAFTIPGKSDSLEFAWASNLGAMIHAGVLGVTGYGALFTFVGLATRRALIFGIAYGFLSEFLLTLFPAVIKKTTLMFYLRSVALRSLTSLGDPEIDRLLGMTDLASTGTAALTVLVSSAVFLALSAIVISRLSFVESRGAEAT